MTARLLVSLSGIGPRTLHRCAALAEELDQRRVPLSVLCNPSGRHSTAVLDWMRARLAGSDELLLHGYTHQRVTRRHAEFAALPAHEAGLRLTAALATVDGLGLGEMRGFVPPRWLGSRGTQLALRQHGIPLCADVSAIRDVRSGAVYRARVHGFGAGFGERTEPWWCFALVLGAGRAARRGGLVRVAVDGADLVRPGVRQALLDAVDLALHHDADGVTYPDVLRPAGQSAADSSRGSTRTSVPSGARLVNSP